MYALAFLGGASGHRTEQRQPPHAARVVQGNLLRDHAAQREANDVRGGYRASMQHVHDVPNEIVEGQRSFDVSGPPVPAQVKAQYPELRSQRTSNLIPACSIGADAVDQHYRRPFCAVVPISECRRALPR
jgi:hypothetical protein